MIWADMKPHLRSLRKDQTVWGVVEESIAQQEVIINFGGDLVRVANKTGRNFRMGQRVLLRIVALQPLEFKLITRTSNGKIRRTSLDLTI